MKRIAVWLLAVCLLCTLACVKEPDEPILQITAEETPAPVDDTPEETPAPEQTPEPTPEPEIYSVVAYAVDEAYYEGDELTKYGIAPTELVLNADRTGKLNLMGSETDIEWTEDGSITAGGQPLYTFIRADADTIVLRVYETEFTLRRSGAQPQSAEASAAPAAQPDGETVEAGASGEPYGDSDGVIERKKLAALYHWLESMQSEFRSLLTFDEIGAAAGKAGCDKQDGDGKYHGAYWTDGNKGVVTVTFRESNGAWTCGSIVCSGIPKDEYDKADISRFPKLGSSAPAGSVPTATVTLEGTCSGKTIEVRADVPETGWYPVKGSFDLHYYSAPSEDKAKNSASYILIEFFESEEKLTEKADTYENVQTLAARKIGGVKMKGMQYQRYGMEWTEFYGRLGDGVWISIKLTGVDLTKGTQTDALLKSLKFKVQ